MNRREVLQLLAAAPLAVAGISRDIPRYHARLGPVASRTIIGWDVGAGASRAAVVHYVNGRVYPVTLLGDWSTGQAEAERMLDALLRRCNPPVVCR